MENTILKRLQGQTKEEKAWATAWVVLIVLIAIPIIGAIILFKIAPIWMLIFLCVLIYFSPITTLLYFVFCWQSVEEYKNKKFWQPPLVFLGLIIIAALVHYVNETYIQHY